mgnify:CR=1 FL=1
MIPKYLRSRTAALHRLRELLLKRQKESKTGADKTLDRDIALVRNGVFSEGYSQKELVEEVKKSQTFSNDPLTFTELMSFNTYFEMNPEKVCGQQQISSSRDFPVNITGTKEDVETAVDRTVGSKNNMELEAEALELELNLLTL